MAGTLNNILNKGSESLQNSRVAIDVTGHNISNAHTAGYSQQTVNLETKWPHQYGLNVFGNGAQIQSITRAHDKFLESQIRREVQAQSRSETLAQGLSKLENFFNPDLTSTIRDRLTSFNNSLRELASYPEEPSVRINVIESGKALAQSFNAIHAGIVQLQNDGTEEIRQHIDALNEKLKEVGKLNTAIREMGAGGQTDVNDLDDKRDLLVKEIANIIDVNIYKDKNDQVVIRGPTETLLVEGGHSSFLKLEDTFITSRPGVLVSEFDKPIFTDLTKHIKTSKIGALLQLREGNSQIIKDKINLIAKNFAESFNELHEQGYGVKELSQSKGRVFFSGVGGPGEPAQDIHVDLSIVFNPSAVSAALSENTAGDNVIANKLVKILDEKIFENNSTTIYGFYDNMIAKLGHETSRAKEDSTASQIVYDKLKSQREANSGVSLDEEAANLLKYQHLFAASSKIITAADDMFKTILDLKR